MNLARVDQLLRRLGPKGAALISLCLLGVLWFVYYLPGDGAAAPSRSIATEAPEQVSQPAEAGPGESDGESNAQYDTASAVSLEESVIRRRNMTALRMLEEGEAALKKLEAASEEWRTRAESVQSGPVGRVLAADTENLPYLMELLSVGTEHAEKTAGYREELNLTSVELSEFLGSDTVREVTVPTVQAIDSLVTDIRDHERAMESSLSELKVSIQRAEGLPEGDQSLDEAFRALEIRQAEQMRRDKIAAREQAEEEMRERLVEAERAKLEAETRLKQTELAAETARLTAMEEETRIAAEKDQEVIAAKLAQEKLEADFIRDLAEIKRLLSPFVTPADYKLYPSGSYLYTGDKTGVSLKVIAYTGALEPTDDGIEAMAELGRTEFRPLGTFPKYVKSEWRRSPEVKERLVRAQELLLKYGDLLVEKGMLEK